MNIIICTQIVYVPFLILGVYFLSLLPSGALDGLIPRIPSYKQRRRGQKRRRRPQPFYYDDYFEYEDDYEYGFRHKYGPPLDHNRRLLRHGPPLFNRRMSQVKPQKDKKIYRRNSFEDMSSMDVDDMNIISSADMRHSAKITKREAKSDINL